MNTIGFSSALRDSCCRRRWDEQGPYNYVPSWVPPCQQDVEESAAPLGNDAPALKQASVGVAIGTGADRAIEASDFILVRGELTGVVEAVNLSRATFRKIKQNLFWAFFYNVFMIPLAIVGWMHAALAEIAMATSAVTVVTNANTLRRAGIRPANVREIQTSLAPQARSHSTETEAAARA